MSTRRLPTVQRWKELFGGSCCLWVGSLRGLVRGFGNEGVVLNEGTVDHGFRPVDPELDECKRDPIVAFLDHAGFAENDFLRYEVIREAVFFTCHKAPPGSGFFVFVDLCVLSWPELCFGWGLGGLAAPLLRLTRQVAECSKSLRSRLCGALDEPIWCFGVA